MDEEGEEAAASRPNVTIPEDLDSREAMVSCALLPLPQLAFSASLCVPPDALIPWSTRSISANPHTSLGARGWTHAHLGTVVTH